MHINTHLFENAPRHGSAASRYAVRSSRRSWCSEAPKLSRQLYSQSANSRLARQATSVSLAERL